MKNIKYNRTKKSIIKDLPMYLSSLGMVVNREVYNLDKGGCCVYASLVARKIKRFFPFITVGLKVCESMSDDEKKRLYEVRTHISNNVPSSWNEYRINFSHIVIMLKYSGITVFLDSNTISYDKEYFPFNGYNKTFHIGYLTIKDGLELSESNDWNEAFARSQIPLLKKTINSEFKKIIRRFV